MNPITFTDAAITHIKKMLAGTPKGIGFALKIKKTGCSGYAYVPEIVTQTPNHSVSFDAKDLHVFIDQDSLTLLDGILVDYAADETGGLKQKRLLFINPKETGRCGCGESFTIDKTKD